MFQNLPKKTQNAVTDSSAANDANASSEPKNETIPCIHFTVFSLAQSLDGFERLPEKNSTKVSKAWCTVKQVRFNKVPESFPKNVGNFCAVRFLSVSRKVLEQVWKAWYRVGLNVKSIFCL